MVKVIHDWMNRYFSDPQAVLLILLLVFGFSLIIFFGNILLPIFVSILLALLLQYWVKLLEKRGVSHTVAYWSVYTMFLVVLFGSFIVLLPLIWKQCVNLIAESPILFDNGRILVTRMIADLPGYIKASHIDRISNELLNEVQHLGKGLVSVSISSIPGIITWMVYLILVPMLVFFFLRDHKKIVRWFMTFLPDNHALLTKVWREMNAQIGNYIRGKCTEILVVGVCTYLVFLFFDLRYQILLATLVGLSVVIPYIGAVVVTIPVVLVGYFQYGFAGGFTGEFALMLYAYLFVQFLDSNILVPILFSEAVNLHPVAIIVAILFFGALWGFWGVFFAIPLATLIKAVMNSWPHAKTLRKRHT